jgi:hypothetical protein
VNLRHIRLVSLLIIVGLSAAGCFAPDFTYVADSSDHTYFKVPPSWHEVSPSSLEAVQGQSTSQGTYLWSRAYDDSTKPSVRHVFQSSLTPVAYASVLALSASERAAISFDAMRDLLLPVTAAARSAANASHTGFTGFALLSDQVLGDSHHDRGIREIFSYNLGTTPETFDLTVLTNSDTTRLYFLLVHCQAHSFASNFPAIQKVVGSFTVGGGS